MKCKELKQALENIDDNTEIGFHIFDGQCDADTILSLVDDKINKRIVLALTDKKYLI